MTRCALAACLITVLVGCGGGTDAADSDGETSADRLEQKPTPSFAVANGILTGHQTREWYGYMEITNASSEQFDFAIEISPDEPTGRSGEIGRINGTAKLRDGRFVYTDGSCEIDFEAPTDAPAAQRGDLFIDANKTCSVMMGIEGHDRGSTAYDILATWRREQPH